MGVYFLGSSVLVKYYLVEPGTGWTRQLVQNSQNVCLVSDIALAKVAAAFAQMQRAGKFGKRLRDEIFAHFRGDMDGNLFYGHPVDEKTLELAATLALYHPLKGYDAVQIASGLLIARETPVPLTLVSGDNQMLRVARAVGLATDNPFDHEDEG